MNPTVAPRRNMTVCFGGAVFFGAFMPFVWMVVTIVTAEQATSRYQDEMVGYAMFLTLPIAGLVAAIAGFLVGFFGDPTRWLLRWGALAFVGAALAVGFNVWMFRTSTPRASVPVAAPATLAK